MIEKIINIFETNNLYKFIMSFGIVVLIASFYLVTIESNKIENEIYLLYKEIGTLNLEVNFLKEDTMSLTNDTNKKTYSFLKGQLDNSALLTKKLRDMQIRQNHNQITSEYIQKKIINLKIYKKISYLIEGISLFFIVFGFVGWYRLQKFIDKKIIKLIS